MRTSAEGRLSTGNFATKNALSWHCAISVKGHNVRVSWQKFLFGITFPSLLALTGCDLRKPVLSEGQIQKIRQNLPGITDTCVQTLRYGGLESMPDATDQCFEMMPQKRWQGLWARGFELSRFCPSPASACSYDTPGSQIWLTQRATIPISKDIPGDTYSIRLFKIEFLGRRTRERGAYGHMGGSRHEIIVDKILSVSEIEVPDRRPPK